MSLKGEAYETTEEVKFRLENTIVLYDGSPVYITRVSVPDGDDKEEVARVFFYPLPFLGRGGVARKVVRKYLSSRKFDLSPFKMGYFNHKNQALYASRIPIRQNKQGLSQATCSLVTVGGKRPEDTDFNTLLSSPGFADMINNKFPSFAEAGDMLGNEENLSVAVSPSFAFVIDQDLNALILMHKNIKCGIAIKGQRALHLSPKFHFLKEEAEECRIPLA